MFVVVCCVVVVAKGYPLLCAHRAQEVLSKLQREIAYVREHVQEEISKRISGVVVDIDALVASPVIRTLR